MAHVRVLPFLPGSTDGCHPRALLLLRSGPEDVRPRVIALKFLMETRRQTWTQKHKEVKKNNKRYTPRKSQDEKATSNNKAVSHQQFFSERDKCVQEGLKKGWQTVRGVKL